jgi:hypothetical protein
VLGSDADGEALAAARAIKRTLHGAGLDMHALAEAIGTTSKPTPVPCTFRAGPVPSYRPSRRRPRTFTEKQTGNHRRMARYCRDNDYGRLSRREREFVWRIADLGRELTIPQADWLTDITDRLEQEDRCPWA